MMTFVVNRMMDLDVESLTGAAYGERSEDRVNQRNGYRERPWHTTLGTLPVAIPKLRKGSYFPSFLEARRTSDKALIAVIQVIGRLAWAEIHASSDGMRIVLPVECTKIISLRSFPCQLRPWRHCRPGPAHREATLCSEG
jgi:Transposase, Mutator family